MQLGQIANLKQFFRTHGIDVHDSEGWMAEQEMRYLNPSAGAANVGRYQPELGDMDQYRLPLTAVGIAVVVALFAILLSRL